MSWLSKSLFGGKDRQKPDPRSETFIMDQALERVRQAQIDSFNKHPALLIAEVQKIADAYPEVIKDYGGVCFMTFAAGMLVERYGILPQAAIRAANDWSYKQVEENAPQ